MQKINVGKPLFENLFGENNTIKVLDFVYMGKDFDFTLTHIHHGTGLSRTAVRNAIEFLLNNKLVIISRADDKSKYYKLNKESDKFKLLNTLYEKVKKEIIAN